MKGTGFIYIFILAAALLSGCIDSLQVGEASTSGESTLTLHISGDPQTRAPLSSTEDNVIQTLGVWLVDATGTIIQYKSTAPSATSTTVEFTTVPRGEHKLYIVANYEGLTGLASTYAVGENISGIENVELKEITTNATAPEFTSTNGVTSSLIKEVVVSPGNNVVEAHLLRAVGRLTVTFRNGTENRDLFVGSVGLSKKNPSRGYLFGKDDHSNPSATTLLNFPDLTNVIKIGPGSERIVYDTYLYESTPAISGDVFKMGVTTGMYDYPTEFQAGMFVEGEITGYEPGDNTKSISSTETWYMIRSVSSSTHYLADDNGLKLVSFTSDNEIPFDDAIKKYCWTFSPTSDNAKIKNVATGREITLSTSSVGIGDNGVRLQLSNDSSGLRFYIQSKSGKNTYNWYLTNSDSTPTVTRNTDNTTIWVLRPVTQKPIATGKHFVGALASTTNSETYDLKYIDMYGVAQNLEHICRNEHVNLTVNVYHHVATGGFVFEVEKWSNVSNETTFD